MGIAHLLPLAFAFRTSAGKAYRPVPPLVLLGTHRSRAPTTRAAARSALTAPRLSTSSTSILCMAKSTRSPFSGGRAAPPAHNAMLSW